MEMVREAGGLGLLYTANASQCTGQTKGLRKRPSERQDKDPRGIWCGGSISIEEYR